MQIFREMFLINKKKKKKEDIWKLGKRKILSTNIKTI